MTMFEIWKVDIELGWTVHFFLFWTLAQSKEMNNKQQCRYNTQCTHTTYEVNDKKYRKEAEKYKI